jgi:hypothetical protein
MGGSMKDNYEFYVAGVKFHQLNSVIDELEEGYELIIEPEPDNKYDPNALMILYDSDILQRVVCLGYVPGKLSAEVSAFVSSTKTKCTITHLDPGEKPWLQLRVSISEEKGA